MPTNRLQREADSREVTERPKQWAPPDLLPEPDKQAGYAYRWIRVSMLDKADPRNISSKLREGWEPVTLEEQPKFKLLANPNGQFKDNIEIGGLLLLIKCRSASGRCGLCHVDQRRNDAELRDPRDECGRRLCQPGAGRRHTASRCRAPDSGAECSG